MAFINDETGEYLPEEAKITIKIPPSEMTNEQLAQYLDEMDYKMSYTITFNTFKKINGDILITKIFSDSEGLSDYKLIGVFWKLVEMAKGYSNSINFKYEKDIIKQLKISKPTYIKYMNRFKEENLVKIISYNDSKCLVVNPIYVNKGYALSAPVFLAFKDILKQHLNPYVYEYYVRMYINCNVIVLRTYKTKYVDGRYSD